jgi:uncharacterized cupin superfamily protein
MSHSIVIADPSTVALSPAPIEPGWIVEGRPEARAKELARSGDGTSVVVAWSCTAGRFRWHYSVDETVHIISGEVFVTKEDGVERRLGPGDMAFFPAGSSSMWRVPTEVRKLAVCRHALPQPLDLHCERGASSSPSSRASAVRSSSHRADRRYPIRPSAGNHSNK